VPVAAKKSTFPLALILGLLLILLLLLGGGTAFALTSGFGLLPKPSPTATVTVAKPTAEATIQPTSTSTAVPPSPTAAPTGSSTPDAVGTQLKSIQETQSAIQASVATATPTNTPNLTATAAACTYDYKLSGQQPDDGKSVVVAIKTTKVLTLTNTGVCAFQPGTVLSETTINTGFTPISFTVPTAAPQATAVVSFDWPGRKSPGTLSRSFLMLDPQLTPIGQPLTFTLKYILGATPIPPATATNPPPAATNTPAVTGLVHVFLGHVSNCRYVGDSGGDYECTAVVTYEGGGGGPFTVSVDNVNSQHINPGQTITIEIRERRCHIWIHTINLFDDASGTGISESRTFDPAANASLFPGGSCTVP
jgi:hypothetical protein